MQLLALLTLMNMLIAFYTAFLISFFLWISYSLDAGLYLPGYNANSPLGEKAVFHHLEIRAQTTLFNKCKHFQMPSQDVGSPSSGLPLKTALFFSQPFSCAVSATGIVFLVPATAEAACCCIKCCQKLTKPMHVYHLNISMGWEFPELNKMVPLLPGLTGMQSRNLLGLASLNKVTR